MRCERCKGTGWVAVTDHCEREQSPCEACGGSGIGYCCDGICEQGESTGAASGTASKTDGTRKGMVIDTTGSPPLFLPPSSDVKLGYAMESKPRTVLGNAKSGD